jgi:uncharacterized protein YndB with AHSA1/START domain
MQTIEKSIEIDAPIEKVYEVLTNPQLVRGWASAFSEGTYAETDWQPGSTVEWKDMNGNVGAKGVVIENEPLRRIMVAYYDDVKDGPPSQPGQYKEVYLVQPGRLDIKAGTLAEGDIKVHEPLWDKAIRLIKELAEK